MEPLTELGCQFGVKLEAHESVQRSGDNARSPDLNPRAGVEDRAATYAALELALTPARFLQSMLYSAIGLLAKGEDSAQISDLLLDRNEEGGTVRLKVPVPDTVLFYPARAGKLEGRSSLNFKDEL